MRTKKFLALLLSFAMLISAFGTVGFANAADAADPYEGYKVVEVSTGEDLAVAIKDATAETPTKIVLSDGTYIPPSDNSYKNKTIALVGSKDVVLDYTDYQVNYAADMVDATIIFDGITVKWHEVENGYIGLKNPKKVVYKNCRIEGPQYMYGDADFIACDFKVANDYAVKSYSAKILNFKDCSFDTQGKAILLYTEASGMNVKLAADNCTFVDNGTKYDINNPKAAIETATDGDNSVVFDTTINSCAAIGFEANKSASPLYGNKNSITADRLSTVIDDVAYVLVNNQDELDKAIKYSSTEFPTKIMLADGTYDPIDDGSYKNKTITFVGSENVVLDYTKYQTGYAQDMTGTNICFEGVTVNWTSIEDYTGLKNPEKVVYSDCTINGLQNLYGDADFIGCEFNNESCWSVWTYGAENVNFKDCTFNTGGHAVLIYNEETSSDFVANVSFDGCTFNNSGTVSEPWGHEDLVETGSNAANQPGSNMYNLSFIDCKIEGEGKDKQELWGNKTFLNADYIGVAIDGEKLEPVAVIGDTGYLRVKDAVEAAKNTNEPIVIGNTVIEHKANAADVTVSIPEIAKEASDASIQAHYTPVVEIKSIEGTSEGVNVNADISIIKTVNGVSEEIQITDSDIEYVEVTVTIPQAANVDVTVIKAGEEDQIVKADANGTFTFKAYSFSPYTFRYTPAAISEESSNAAEVIFKEVSSSDESTTYNIVLKSTNAEELNRVTSAEMNISMENNTGFDVGYEVSKSGSFNVSADKDGKFLFNLPEGSESLINAQVGEIVLGKVVVSGYTYKPYETEATATISANSAAAQYKSVKDSLKKDITVDVTNSKVKYSKKVATSALTVNVSFPNSIKANAADYQDMKVTIADGNEIYTYNLGNSSAVVTAPFERNVSYDTATNSYVIENTDLTKNSTYTVTVEGAGYRKASYSVRLTQNKTLNFWNNVMTDKKEVEVNEINSAKTTTFLAGDIVKDNRINIYDLAAVVSYFGEKDLPATNKDYAKYDLNRDGKVDSRDVAYVLVSWGN